ncbi:hypothetical protein [Streptomyces sp. CC210A]|uniref:hypothetical protein n=1 Tax=Streptomyces sp. CC210A TaxID=2898184 RepID=UPI001F492807|nr:hypothetical protein [Streptomyces sp. CC210A]
MNSTSGLLGADAPARAGSAGELSSRSAVTMCHTTCRVRSGSATTPPPSSGRTTDRPPAAV